jgi:hypothetical protein
MPKGVYPRPIRPVIFVIGPGIAYVPLTMGLFALIEADSAHRVIEKGWHAHYRKESDRYYAIGSRKPGKQARDHMHRVIMDAPEHLEVDHKNGNGLDNRRNGNLRLARKSQNQANSRLRIDNTCGLKGVSRYRKKFMATIQHEGKQQFLGCFVTPEAAHAAYCARAKELFGEFARFG